MWPVRTRHTSTYATPCLGDMPSTAGANPVSQSGSVSKLPRLSYKHPAPKGYIRETQPRLLGGYGGQCHEPGLALVVRNPGHWAVSHARPGEHTRAAWSAVVVLHRKSRAVSSPGTSASGTGPRPVAVKKKRTGPRPVPCLHSFWPRPFTPRRRLAESLDIKRHHESHRNRGHLKGRYSLQNRL